jgi:hypothetical protein
MLRHLSGGLVRKGLEADESNKLVIGEIDIQLATINAA